MYYFIVGDLDSELFLIENGTTAAIKAAWESIKYGMSQEVYVYKITKMPEEELNNWLEKAKNDLLDVINEWKNCNIANPNYATYLGCLETTDKKKDVEALFNE